MSDAQEILLVHQEHNADKAGLHTDWRIVLGDRAYSWATKKDVPKPGEKILLHEQPIHDREYALSEKIVIPKGQYGAGTTTLKYAQRGVAEIRHDDLYKLRLNDGQCFTIKKLPKLGEKAWMCMNTTNKYLEKIASLDKSAMNRYTKELLKRFPKGAGQLAEHAPNRELSRNFKGLILTDRKSILPLQYDKGYGKVSGDAKAFVEARSWDPSAMDKAKGELKFVGRHLAPNHNIDKTSDTLYKMKKIVPGFDSRSIPVDRPYTKVWSEESGKQQKMDRLRERIADRKNPSASSAGYW